MISLVHLWRSPLSLDSDKLLALLPSLAMVAPLISKLKFQQHVRFGTLFDASSIAISQRLIPRPTRLCRHPLTRLDNVWLKFWPLQDFNFRERPQSILQGIRPSVEPSIEELTMISKAGNATVYC
ncbi:hypothetical protein [Picosynechococcus sp. PCC 7003]|uniref:hypothetical protein n=1 Tax=Picosynechococcus sp. PCC 7003 TaxID=374981 RepID=UPI0012EEBDC1|nr:hypothetical protein [Picosynechococcus sp. PCC 7003]